MKKNFFSFILIAGLFALIFSCNQSRSTKSDTDKNPDPVNVSMNMSATPGKDDQLRGAMHKLWGSCGLDP